MRQAKQYRAAAAMGLGAWLAAFAMLSPSSAQENDDTRFSLQPSGEGFVRLDRKTGAMSFCALDNGQLVCRLAADERDAYEKEIARLEGRLDALGETGPETGPKTTDRLRKSPEAEEREFEKAMDYAERAMRRFFDMVQGLRDEMQDRRDSQ